MTEKNKILNSVNKIISNRYLKELEKLNSNMFTAEKTDQGFNIPTFELSEGGMTQFTGKEPLDIDANGVAVSKAVYKEVRPLVTIYRFALSYNELTVGMRNPKYLIMYIDTIIKKAISTYKLAVGSENDLRWGEYFIKLKAFERNFYLKDHGGDEIELRLEGNWASNELVKSDLVVVQDHFETYEEKVSE